MNLVLTTSLIQHFSYKTTPSTTGQKSSLFCDTMNASLRVLYAEPESDEIEDVGQVTIEGNRISWIIRDFFNFPKTLNTSVVSLYFYFKQKKFIFYLYPNGSARCPEWISLALKGYSESDAAWHVKFEISGDSDENSPKPAHYLKDIFFVDRFIPKERLIEEKDRLVTNGTLRINAYLDTEGTAVLGADSGLAQMKYFEDVGEVTINGRRISWLIRDFFNFLKTVNTCLVSPDFYLRNVKFYFSLYPNGSTEYSEWIKLEFIGHSKYVNCQVKFGIRGDVGDIELSRAERIEKHINDHFCSDFLIRKEHLIKETDRLVPNGNLHIFASLDIDVAAVLRAKSESVEMNLSEDVGEVTIKGNRISWTISEFYKLPNNINTCIISPYFYFKDKTFRFFVYPNGVQENPAWVKLELCVYSKCDSWQVKFGISGDSGDMEISCAQRIERYDDTFCVDRFIRKERLIPQNNGLVTNGTLCIFAIQDLEDAAVLGTESGLVQMSMCKDFGEVTSEGRRISWLMIKFFNFSNVTNTCIVSPDFNFKEKTSFFSLYSNGYEECTGWLKLVLIVNSKCDSWQMKFGINCGEDVEISCAQKLEFASSKELFYVDRFIRKERLFEEQDRLVPNGTLRIFAIQYANADVANADVLGTELAVDTGKLENDFRELLISGNLSDFTLKVKDKEFKVHRSVLGARSPAFLNMLMHDTKEKESGKIDIENVDPEVFSNFLHYLYTGRVDTLTQENMLELFVTAVKYQVDELKSVCMNYIRNNITTNNFGDVLTVAQHHNEKTLITLATEFLHQNAVGITFNGTFFEMEHF